jgi:hypothetical protein
MAFLKNEEYKETDQEDLSDSDEREMFDLNEEENKNKNKFNTNESNCSFNKNNSNNNNLNSKTHKIESNKNIDFSNSCLFASFLHSFTKF